MNALERTMATVRGEPRDRLSNQPIIMLLAARDAGVSYRDYVSDHRVLVDAQVRACETYGIDTLSCCSDAWREAGDAGAELLWFDDAPPGCRRHVLEEKGRLSTLRMPTPDTGPRMADRVSAVALFAERSGGEAPILGWVEGPVAESVDLRGMSEFMLDTIDDLPFVLDLMEWVTEMEIGFARAQVAAGAHVIGVGDAAASLVSPRFYEAHAFPRAKRIVDAVHDAGALVRLHVCGNTTHLLDAFGRLGADIIDIDHMVDLTQARRRIGPDPVLLGNFDPVAVVKDGTPETVGAACAAAHAAAGEPYIVGAGCEIPPGTPPANLRALSNYAQGTP
jgi:MtaA/CmuA family methyltransferase